ncbi:TIGR03943 family putative permease subunit [Subtercola boreus]|uniref:TIGR03943 family protein n=1 Tax=Subtercola boreus TaxID=120213 RepID=A0A3E0WGK0_9MICO|nr:TIGR03943 family protein [Subtercola boreus]RFA23585.1 TIGR03943 family protein [Subtercola boreus]RFA23979.1 TIGR03943 family protein [Subtercola boreus]RFA29677.1 TIGR03943 family protein [Subtercola boreus]
MSFSRLVSRWQGLALSLIGVTATVWLGFAGQLGLYIHPRYYVFTLVMAAIAVVLIVGAFAVVPTEGDDDAHDHAPGGHEHAHDHAAGGHDLHPAAVARSGRSPRTRRLRMLTGTAASLAVVAAAVTALLVVPPTTLTSSTVAQRSINNASATLPGEGSASAASAGDDTSSYTVKNWSLLMRQGVGLDYFDGRAATVTGFVTPDADDPDNVFFVARFVVTCCAVDAQPVGVAVYRPGWQSSYPTDSWVSVDGTFGADPSVLSTANIVLQPDAITGIAQPSDPYVY